MDVVPRYLPLSLSSIFSLSPILSLSSILSTSSKLCVVYSGVVGLLTEEVLDSLGEVVVPLEGDIDGLALVGEVEDKELEDKELGESWILCGPLSTVSLNLFGL